ncbi:MAG: SpoIIE family protein phosphatase [Salinivirgaceae bacterium]|nr:SpoIIE family protein phosphatase [Salinivirgaceae bacterium]
MRIQLTTIFSFFIFLVFTPDSFALRKSNLAEKGVLDLSEINRADFKSASLNGQWIFFPDTLIPPDGINNALKNLPYKYINVPSNRKETENTLYGTYFLLLKLNEKTQKLTIQSLTIYSAASIFVNQKLVGNIGKPSQSIETTEPGLILHSNYFYSQKRNQIVIHYSNFYREKHGLANNVTLVTPKQRVKQAAVTIIKFGIIIGTILFIIFSQINYFIIQRGNYTSFYFGIASIMIATYIIFMSIYHLGALFPDFTPNFFISLKVWRISYYMTLCFFALFIHSLFPSIYHKFFLYLFVGVSIISLIIVISAPLNISSINLNYFMLFTLFFGIHGVITSIIGKIRGIEDSGLFLLGFGFFLATVINDILHNLLIIKSVNLLDVGIFGMMLTQAQIINLKLSRSLNKSEKLSSHLQYVNANLEGLVHKRTEEIEEQKSEIEAQRDFAISQNKLISKQKKTITDSINYALEIQKAVLPDEDVLRQYFDDSFILFKPKDYVSGDFYWIRHFHIDGTPYLLFCAADCTGHGVPGALLSMLGMSLLGEIMGHNEVHTAADVLELLRTKFKQTICTDHRRENSSDGMHISLCLINKTTNEMQYSGAFQALYYIRKNELRKIKGTYSIIGNYMQDIPFENHVIQLKKGDRLYLFTDGFADQMSETGQGRFMQKRLVNLLWSFENETFENQRNTLNHEFETWKGDFEQIDDVLVMGIKV